MDTTTARLMPDLRVQGDQWAIVVGREIVGAARDRGNGRYSVVVGRQPAQVPFGPTKGQPSLRSATEYVLRGHLTLKQYGF